MCGVRCEWEAEEELWADKSPTRCRRQRIVLPSHSVSIATVQKKSLPSCLFFFSFQSGGNRNTCCISVLSFRRVKVHGAKRKKTQRGNHQWALSHWWPNIDAHHSGSDICHNNCSSSLNDKTRAQLVVSGADCVLRQPLQLLYRSRRDIWAAEMRRKHFLFQAEGAWWSWYSCSATVDVCVCVCVCVCARCRSLVRPVSLRASGVDWELEVHRGSVGVLDLDRLRLAG